MEGLVGGIIGLVLGFAMAFLVSHAATVARRVECKLDALIRHQGIDLAKVAMEEAAALYRAGKKIEAIKLYRDYTGCSLAEAKSRVEALA